MSETAHEPGERNLGDTAKILESLMWVYVGATPDSIIVIDSEQKIVLFNEAAQKTFGYFEAEVSGKDLSCLLPATAAENHRKFVEKFRSSSKKFMDGRPEIMGRRKDGSLFSVEATILRSSLNGEDYMAAVLRDITALKLSQKEERDSSERLRVALSHVPLGLFNQDLDLSYTWLFAPNHTYIPKDMEGLNETHFMPEPFAEQIRAKKRRVIETGQGFREELVLTTFVGERVIDLSVEPLFDDRQQIVGVTGVSFDLTDRKATQARLTAIEALDQLVASKSDLEPFIQGISTHLVDSLKGDLVRIYTPEESGLSVCLFAGGTLRMAPLERSQDGIEASAIRERQMILAPDLADPALSLSIHPGLRSQGFVSAYAAPLISRDQVFGVLAVYYRKKFEADPEWISFFEALCAPIAIALDEAMVLEQLRLSNIGLLEAYDATIGGWSMALDLRDKETEGHSVRVTELALEMSQRLGVDESEMINIRRGAQLHDIGKMGIPDSILLKPEPLEEDEMNLMRKHPEMAIEMLASVEYLRPALDIPYCHHEKWNGTGYPRGLVGEEIPLSARIFAVVDVWDALTNDRPYRKAWSRKKALEYISNESGSHFDPKVVSAFLEMMAD